MKLQSRSFSTKHIRPKPMIHNDEEDSFIVIVNAWGQPEHGQKVMDEVVKYVNASKSDVEVTSPFESLPCLPDEVNYLRTAISIANEVLYRSENKVRYFTGVEILTLIKKGQQLAWAQVGCPSVYIQRREQKPQPLTVGIDLSTEFTQNDQMLPPLPAQLIGLESTLNVQCGYTKVESGDQLVLLSSCLTSSDFFSVNRKSQTIKYVTDQLIKEYPEMPFWLGLIDL